MTCENHWMPCASCNGTGWVPVKPEPVLKGVSLSDALYFGIVRGMTIEALRKASHRPGFPEPAGHEGLSRVYDPRQLREWDERRGR